MTDAEKDAAWRSLPEKVKEEMSCDYSNALQAHSSDPNNPRIDAHIKFLEEYFGKHNLTASEEREPKEKTKVRKINVGDIVRVKRETPCSLYNNMPYAFVDMPFFVTEIEVDCDNNLNDIAHLRNGSTYLNIHPHWLQKEDIHHKWEQEPKDGERVESSSSLQNEIPSMSKEDAEELARCLAAVDDAINKFKDSQVDWLAYRMELAKEVVKKTAFRDETPTDIVDATMTIVNGIVERLKGGEKWLLQL